jgi:ATP-dependent DNA helicase PIF1
MILSDEQQDVLETILSLPGGEVIYVDGEAGTGKSFTIQKACSLLGNVLKCAPSGIASTNIGGRTFHKTFQLNGDFYFDRNCWRAREDAFKKEFKINMGDKDSRSFFLGKFAAKLCKHRVEILKLANAIWVDEAPMVRCDLVDEADIRLRYAMNKPHFPFGGKRMIFSGDLGQLQPVVSEEDAVKLEAEGYVAPFGFLQARVFQEGGAHVITKHLTKLFRQKDPIEGAILSRLRTASQTQADLDHINRNVTPHPSVGATVLTYFKRTAISLNNKALNGLITQELTFEATRTGTYKQKWPDGKFKQAGHYAEVLKLKVGCRIIIKSNGVCNIDGCKIPYHNGDAGMLIEIDKQERLLIERSDGQVIRLARKKVGDTHDKKEKITVVEEDEETGEKVEVERTVLTQVTKGQFIQYPLSLGYAQTGHSAQGLTLKRVHIELPMGARPRSPNWIYVVFSRAESLKELTLNRPLTMEDVYVIDGLKSGSNQQYGLAI